MLTHQACVWRRRSCLNEKENKKKKKHEIFAYSSDGSSFSFHCQSVHNNMPIRTHTYSYEALAYSGKKRFA